MGTEELIRTNTYRTRTTPMGLNSKPLKLRTVIKEKLSEDGEKTFTGVA